MPDPQPESFLFEDDGRIPNNPDLPVLVYRGAIPDAANMASAMKARFGENGWTNSWRDGIYDFHHYHSTAHEVIGIAGGQVRMRFGGDGGVAIDLGRGDVAIIPAGVGHKNESSGDDLVVIGAYDGGRDWDLCHGEPQERPAVEDNIRQVPRPGRNPVTGGPIWIG